MNNSKSLEFSELRVVAMSSDYNKIYMNLQQMFKMLSSKKTNPNVKEKEQISFEEIKAIIQDGNQNYN